MQSRRQICFQLMANCRARKAVRAVNPNNNKTVRQQQQQEQQHDNSKSKLCPAGRTAAQLSLPFGRLEKQ